MSLGCTGLPLLEELLNSHGGLAEAALPSSLCGVVRPDGTAEQHLLVASTGGGDLFLIDRSSGATRAVATVQALPHVRVPERRLTTHHVQLCAVA